jgi:hypothetical protein
MPFMITSSRIQSLKNLLDIAEQNVLVARKNTGILENQWRVTEAIDIRNAIQKAYNRALADRLLMLNTTTT